MMTTHSQRSCMQGGATQFHQLDVAVQPEQGAALLFFPAFKDGCPDPRSAAAGWTVHKAAQPARLQELRHAACRTVHSAEPAVATKWILQQWLVQGWSPSGQAGRGQLPPVTSLPPAGDAGLQVEQ